MTLYITAFEFGTDATKTLSDTGKITAQGGIVRLAKVRGAAKLPGRPFAGYSTDDDIYVRTRTFAPGAIQTFDFVEVIGEEPVDENDTAVTSFSFRAFDGTDVKFWNGATWIVAGAGDWNTLLDFNANLNALSASQLAIEVRLKTADRNYTPYLSCVRLRWTGKRVNAYQEWIYRTLVQSLKANIRPLTDVTFASDGAAAVDISTFFDAGFDIVDVVEVYDHTTDPTHTTNLLSGFDANTQVVTLSSAIPENHTSWLVARYSVDVAVTTSTDFVDDAKVPAIWITSVNPRGSQKQIGATGPSVVDRSLSPPQGTVYPQAIALVDLDFTVAIIAPTALDLTQLTQSFSGWMLDHPNLRSTSLDESVTLSPGRSLQWATDNSDSDDTRITTASFALLDIPIYHDSSQTSAATGAGSAPVDGVKAVERVMFNWQPADGGDEQTSTE